MSRARGGAFRPVWRHPGTAQEPRRRPTEGPREPQDSPKRPQEASRGAQTRQGAISKRFWSDFGGAETSKNLKISEFRGFRDFAREPSTEAQKDPKGTPWEAQMIPRRAPGGPRSGPRAPKTAPRGARSAPRGAQDPQEGPKGPQATQTPPGSPSGAHSGLILGPPGLHFRAF